MTPDDAKYITHGVKVRTEVFVHDSNIATIRQYQKFVYVISYNKFCGTQVQVGGKTDPLVDVDS
jgi:hypothetical protein